jgi:hypothetical protein
MHHKLEFSYIKLGVTQSLTQPLSLLFYFLFFFFFLFLLHFSFLFFTKNKHTTIYEGADKIKQEYCGRIKAVTSNMMNGMNTKNRYQQNDYRLFCMDFQWTIGYEQNDISYKGRRVWVKTKPTMTTIALITT